VKYFTWDDAKNDKLKADRGIGFEEIVFLIGQGHARTPLNTRTDSAMAVNGSSSCSVTITCTSCHSSEIFGVHIVAGESPPPQFYSSRSSGVRPLPNSGCRTGQIHQQRINVLLVPRFLDRRVDNLRL
jgi:hypothetical protein